MSATHLSSTRFTELELPQSVLQGLAEANLEFCTPIQELTLPFILQQQDVAGQAQTGTGKTAAFLIAVYNRLLLKTPADTRRKNQPRALILSPTRELAVQIHKDAEQIGKYTGLRICLCFGGTGYEQQRKAVQDGVDILIGTPGRIIDYFKQKVFDLRELEVAVLDEADRMFDLGFINDVRYLFRRMPEPEKRLSMLFSATLSLRVSELAYEHMDNPLSLLVETDKVTADNVSQVVYHPANNEKIPLLVGLLRNIAPKRSLIFVNTKRAADRINAYLLGNGFDVGVLSGDVRQTKRLSLLRRFQSGELALMIATDVAARGLHVADVTHVFNFDLPQNAEDYVHRIGRTARAGKSGAAISFACEDSAFALPEIESYLGHPLDSAPISDELLAKLEAPVKTEPRKPHKSARPSRRPADNKNNSRNSRNRRPRSGNKPRPSGNNK